MKLTGAEIFVECLKREGVKTLFALPGGVVLKIFDVLHQQKGLDVILTRHDPGLLNGQHCEISKLQGSEI